MAADKDTRSRDPEIRQWLEDHDYLMTARVVHELTRNEVRPLALSVNSIGASRCSEESSFDR